MSKVRDIMSKSAVAKQAHKGKDMGKKGKNFEKISDGAAAEYSDRKAGDRVAGAILEKMRKKGKL